MFRDEDFLIQIQIFFRLSIKKVLELKLQFSLKISLKMSEKENLGYPDSRIEYDTGS